MSLSAADRLFRERQSGDYECTVKDKSGNAIPLAKVTALTLTLIDVGSGTVINSRDNQDVLNDNNVTLHATSGLLTWDIRPADNAIVGTVCAGRTQRHRATFEIFWTDGDDFEHNWDVEIEVVAVDSVS